MYKKTHLITHIFKHLLICLITFYSTNIYADTLPIVVDGSTNTAVISAPNGVDLVNIAAPDGGGVSRNNFSDYNVNRSGLILNNASVIDHGTGAVSTNLGGMIMTNHHLRESGAANVILNQVTSNRISRINGFTEIAGRGADLIIANPNGIIVNGGGFINTDRLGLVVGREDRGSGDLNFRLSSTPHIESGFLPTLTITGNGIDLETVNSTEFAANLIRIAGNVYADNNDVKFLSGDNTYNYNNSTVNSNDDVVDSQIAIDASSLSQIQAGNIYMIASKEGFGVKYSGSMIANLGTIDVNANGDIEFGSTSKSIANKIEVSANNNHDITINDGSHIVAGSSGLTFNANNINQLSKNSIVVNGDHTISAINYTNTGRIDISGNLIMNITNDLTNDTGALIYAGNNMYLNIGNNLTNNQDAAIYAVNDLFIRKLDPTDPLYDANDNRINKLENISGDIISFAGDINIDADEVVNKRGEIYTQNTTQWIGPCYGYAWEEHCSLHEEASYIGNITRAARIDAGNNININSNYTLSTLSNASLTNQSSYITAANDINIKTGTLNNNSNTFRSYTKFLDHPYWWRRHSYWIDRLRQLPYQDLVEESFPSAIKAGGGATVQAINDISNTKEVSNASLDPILERNLDIVDSLDLKEVLQNGQIDFDFSSFFDGGDYQGIIQKSTNPNTPLFETRSQFIDQDQFFASNYFYEALGVNLDDLNTQLEQDGQRMIGDQFFQYNLISNQMKAIANNRFLLSQTEVDPNIQNKQLIDNAALEADRLGLDLNTALTQDQINNLERDILWYELKEVNDGVNDGVYVIPKIYLSQATRDQLKNNDGSNKGLVDKGTIFAKNDLSITSSSGSIANDGSIIAGNDLTLTANNDINNNNFSQVISGNDLSITSNNGSITNRSKIEAQSSLSLTAALDITNTSTVATNAANLLNADNPAYISNGSNSSNTGNITSTLIETASLSGNNITINAGNDFNNIGADITANNNLSITAANDINIETVQLRNRSEHTFGSKKKRTTIITDTTTNIASNITANNNLTLTATNNNINITGSNLTANNNLSLNSGNNTIIQNAVDKDYSFIQTTKKGTTRTSVSTRTDYVETALKSILNGKNIDITSNNNILIQGSDTNANYDDVNDLGGDTTLTALNQTIITNAILNEYHHSSRSVSNRGVFKGVTAVTSFAIDLALINAAFNPLIQSAMSTLKAVDKDLYKDTRRDFKDFASNNQYHTNKTTTNINNNLTRIESSNINSDDDTTITSTTTTIQGSNLASGLADQTNSDPNITGSTTINSDTLNILAASTYNITSTNQKTKRTNTFRINNSTDTSINYTNSTLSAKNDNFTFNVTNAANISGKDLNTNTPAYLTSINNQATPNLISQTNLSDSFIHTDTAVRGLTDVGTATVAVAVVAAVAAVTILTAGTATAPAASLGATALGAGATAAGTAALTTATISATNASMNAEGDAFKQAKSTSKITWDDTTSRQSMENYAIAFATAYLTAGISEATGLTETARNVNSVQQTTALQQFRVALAQSTLSNTVSTATQSAISGESFSDASRNMMRDIVVGALSNLAAKEIGRAVHGNTDDQGYVLNNDGSRSTLAGYEYQQISKPTQLTLHAILGCGSASAGGGDCASGAMAGVTGELAAEYTYNNLDNNLRQDNIKNNNYDPVFGYFPNYEQQRQNRQIAIEMAGLAGALSTLFTGSINGLSDKEMAENIYVGSRVGKNAGENNALYIRNWKVPYTEWFSTKNVKDFDLDFGIQATLTHVTGSIGTDGFITTGELNPTIGIAGYISIAPRGEDEFATVTYGIRSGPAASVIVTDRGNHGLSASFGPAIVLYPILYNISKEIPLEKLNISKK